MSNLKPNFELLNGPYTKKRYYLQMHKFFVAVFLCFSFCFDLDAAPITIKNWQMLGPFLAAPQEGAIDHLYFDGGQEKAAPDKREYLSPIAPRGAVKWTPLSATSGEVRAELKNIDWKFLKNFGGNSITAAQTYFYAEIEREAAGVLLVNTKSVGEFFVNGTRYFGEPYTFTFNQVAAKFEKGVNRILLKVSSWANPEFEFSLEESAAAIKILNDITAPDLVVGEKLSAGWIGIPLLNTTENWVRDLRIEVLSDNVFAQTKESFSIPLAPLSVLKIPVKFAQKTSTDKSAVLRLKVFSGSKVLIEEKIMLRLRKPLEGEGVKKTFLSKHDDSVQYYSLLYPKKFNAKKSYELFVYLHGANVEAADLTDRMAPKDNAFVLAPTNRRPHGFAYQDLGRLDVLETIEHVSSAYEINPRGVFLGGHSMGGQGTWHIGLHHPSHFAGLAPSAGWTSFQLYSPFIYQRAALSLSPELASIRDRVLVDSNNPFFVENAANLPVYISQADKDDNVPAFHSRLFNLLARNQSMTTEYREIDSKEHWFSAPLNEGRGFDSMDHPAQYHFLRENAQKKWPEEFSVRLMDLSIEQNFYWVTINEQEKIFSHTRLDAKIRAHKIELKTSNILELSLQLPKDLMDADSAEIVWNGHSGLFKIPSSRKLSLSVGGKGVRASEKTALNSAHTLKAGFTQPYLIIYGSSGTANDTEILLQSARLLSHKAWRTANAFAPIVRDGDVTPQMIKKYNLILIGGPDKNALTKKFNSQLPLKISQSEIRFGAEKIAATKSGLATAFIFPNPENREHFVVVFAGTNSTAEKFAPYFQPFYDRLGFGSPDFLIYSEAVKNSGWAGVEAAGFFSKAWDLKNKDFALR